jgi:hypothetical protein
LNKGNTAGERRAKKFPQKLVAGNLIYISFTHPAYSKLTKSKAAGK